MNDSTIGIIPIAYQIDFEDTQNYSNSNIAQVISIQDTEPIPLNMNQTTFSINPVEILPRHHQSSNDELFRYNLIKGVVRVVLSITVLTLF